MDLTAGEVIEYVTTLQQDFSVFRTEAERDTLVAMMNLVPDLEEDFARDTQVNILGGDPIDAGQKIRSQVLTFPTSFTTLATTGEPGGTVPQALQRKSDNLERINALYWSKVNRNRRLDRRRLWRQLFQPLAVFVQEMMPITSPNPAKRFPWRIFDVPLDTCGWIEEDDMATHFGREYNQAITDIAAKYSRLKGSGTDHEGEDLFWDKGEWGWKSVSDSYSPRIGRAFMGARGFNEGKLMWYANEERIYAVALNSPTSKLTVGPGYVLNHGNRVSSGELVLNIENPFGRCPVYLVPGNDTPLALPADKYQAFLLPLIKTTEQINYIDTVRATKSRNRATFPPYAPMQPEFAKAYMASHGGKMPPAIELPNGTIDYTWADINNPADAEDLDMDKLDQRLEDRAARFRPQAGAQLTDPQVVSNATAAGLLAMIDSNALTLAPLISAGDTMTRQSIDDFHASVRWLGKKGKAYATFILSSNGDTGAVRVKSLKPGDSVQVDPDALDFDFETRVLTQSKTTSQTQAKIAIARLNMEPTPDGGPGTGTHKDLYAAADIDDQEAQEEQQVIESMLIEAQPVLASLALAGIKAKFLLDQGIDLDAIAQIGAQNAAVAAQAANAQPTGGSGVAPPPPGSSSAAGLGAHTSSPGTEAVGGGSDAVLST